MCLPQKFRIEELSLAVPSCARHDLLYACPRVYGGSGRARASGEGEAGLEGVHVVYIIYEVYFMYAYMTCV